MTAHGRRFPTALLLCSLVAAVLLLQATQVNALSAAEWFPGPWSNCSRPCGGGMRNRTMECAFVRTGTLTDRSSCPAIMPMPWEVCNLHECAAINRDNIGFSCNGGNECPVYAQQGGLLTITALGAKNLPDLDGWGAAGGNSDPFVRATIGKSVRQTDTAAVLDDGSWAWTGSASGVMYFGMKESLTSIKLQLWDHDIGLEGGDDLMGEQELFVPACSEWLGRVCSEEAWVSLSKVNDCVLSNSTQPCVRLRMHISPLEVTVVQTHSRDSRLGATTLAVTVPGDPSFGNLYLRTLSAIVADAGRFRRVKGGTVVHTRSSENALAVDRYLTFRLNIACRVYLFFDYQAPSAAWLAGLPPWVAGNGFTEGLSFLTIATDPSGKEYKALYKDVPAGTDIVMHGPRYGLPTSVFPPSMYGIIVKPIVDEDAAPPVTSLEFDRVGFLLTCAQFLPPLLIIGGMVLSFLRRIHFRMDLVAEHLLLKTQPMPTDPAFDANADLEDSESESEAEDEEEGEGKKLSAEEKLAQEDRREARAALRRKREADANNQELVAALFACHLSDGTLNNRHFLRYVWFARATVWLLVASPFAILATWGWVATVNVSPPALGHFLIFVGCGGCLLAAAGAAWYYAGWRLMRGTAAAMGVALVSLLCFQLAVVFDDPRPLSMFSLHVALLTLNMIPMTVLVFMNARELREAFNQMDLVVNKHEEHLEVGGVSDSKDAEAMSGGDTDGFWASIRTNANAADVADLKKPTTRPAGQAFRALVGGTYSVDPHHPGGHFRLVDMVGALFHASPAATLRRSRGLYAAALAVLVWLAGTTWAHAEAGNSQGLATLLTVATCDAAVYLLHRGSLSWSPGFLVFLMAAARACVAATAGELWLVGHSLAFMVFGVALGLEIVGRRLPKMTNRSASSIAYFGSDPGAKHDDVDGDDVAGSPEFVLAFLSFAFLLMLLAAVFITGEEALPDLVLLGWTVKVWVFGLAAFLLVLVVCATTATVRSLQLHQAGILHIGWYFMTGACSLPIMLAAITGMLLVCSALLLMAVTGATIMVELATFLPILLVLGFKLNAQWVANDYQLLQPAELRPGAAEAAERKAAAEAAAEQVEDGMPDLRDPNVVAGHSSGSGRAADALGGALGAASQTAVALPPLQRSDGDGADVGVVMPVMPMALPAMGSKRVLGSTRKVAPDTTSSTGGSTKEDPEAKGEDNATGNASSDEDASGDEEKPAGKRLSGKEKLVSLKHSASQRFLKWRDVDGDPTEISDFQAFLKGKLTAVDYRTVFSLALFLTLILVMGLVVATAEGTPMLGHALWLTSYILLLTLLPVVKYFNTFEWSLDMRISAALGWLLFLVTLVLMFAVQLEGDLNNELALWTLTVLLLYPATVLAAAALFHWRDSSWHVGRLVKVGLSLSAVAYTFWVFLMYVWGSAYWGFSLTVALLVFAVILWYLHVWASNDYYLPPNYTFLGRLIILSLAVVAALVGLLFDVDLFYCFSLAFLFVVFRHLGRALSRYLARPPDSPLYFSALIFPIYGYDPVSHRIVSENRLGGDVAVGLAVALLWGVFATIFVAPIGVGLAITSIVLTVTTVFVLYAISNAPVRIGSAGRFFDLPMLKQAAQEASSGFEQRRHAFSIVCDEFVERDRREAELQRQLDRYALNDGEKKDGAGGGHAVKRASAGALAGAIWDAERHMRVQLVHEEAKAVNRAGKSVRFGKGKGGGGGGGGDDEDEEAVALLGGGPVWKRRPDAWYSLRDVLWDAWARAEGPLQWLFLWSAPYAFYATYFRKSSSAGRYNADGSRKKAADVKDSLVDHAAIRRGLWYRHAALSREFYEEQRMIAHFQVLLLVAADARLRTEAVLFQKFLREYRFKLMANGVHPPEDIFRTQSYATVNVQLVAAWLTRLTPEQRERFRQLKERFGAEVDAQFEMRLAADREQAAAAEQLAAERRVREHEMWQKRWLDFQQRRINRRKAGLENEGANVGKSEVDINNDEYIKEVEVQHLYCRSGLHGREHQFHDPEFPPSAESVGYAQRADMVEGWRVSTGINITAGLFADGTDPDDVFQGQLADGWLLSAISILAASGGVSDGAVDELVDRLFVTKETSEVGMYIVRFWKNAQWESIIVDDYFPVLNGRFNSTRCAGAAFAYSDNFNELWVPILEKAMAKYYGSYAALEQGYVHHALQDLTGFESEEVFLAEASRGSNKRQLWNNLLLWRKNHFLLGAGTVLPSSSDRELMESGLVFGAAYVVYDVRALDGLKLIQLRNPPGDHGEWTGDWGDDSPLWTKRLKAKLGYVNDDEDGTFWMSFDDFCLAFRSLYVCRYYDPTKWNEMKFTGWWKGPTAAGLPSKHNPGCKLWLNPQFSLRIDRPTDICLTITQSLPDVTMYNNPQPIAVYVVAIDTEEVVVSHVQGLPDDAPEAEKRAFAGLGHETGLGGSVSTEPRRVRALTNTNVVVHSGKPRRERELTIYATLQPRMYTVLVAPYQRGMEGPFTIKMWSNYEVAMSRLWPPPREGEEGAGNQTMAQKMAKKAADARNKARHAVSARMGATLEGIDKESKQAQYDDEVAEAHEAMDAADDLVREAQATQEIAAASVWVEQYDPTSDRTYYYNMETGESQWDVPEELQPSGIEQGDKEVKTYGEETKKKKKKKVEEGPKCNICQKHRVKGQKDEYHRLWNKEGRQASDLLYCSGGCGAQVHPLCAGFSDTYPPPDPWTCPVCGDEDEDDY